MELTAIILSLLTVTQPGEAAFPPSTNNKSPDLNLKVIPTVPIHPKSTSVHNRIME